MNQLHKDKIEYIKTYRGVKVVYEHNLNLRENVNNIYTLCGIEKYFTGNVNEVEKFIDDYFTKI